ncbi:MAG: class III poly(R)-hydroxyalkanoic acid synthase subunit PhaC [Bacteroidetes Order II. Incertae sedis bacterium]|nr:class III poly(R)-hydroxyalkanoic acid synthase subunit PhaC [Bacteroidetes Order II. bacterium]
MIHKVMMGIQLDPAAVMNEVNEVRQKINLGIGHLGKMKESEIKIGPTPYETVFQMDKVRLFKYTPTVSGKTTIPLLISYALVNRPTMVDLQEDRSLVKNLLDLGVTVYMIDWGYPSRADRCLTLEDYINGYIDACVDHIRDAHNLEKIHLLGICQGGVMATCYTALHQDKIANLITMVMPVDFHIEPDEIGGLLNCWMKDANVDLMVDTLGNMPGDVMNFGYLLLKPYALGVQKYVEMVDVLDKPKALTNFMRMEKWIFDSPDQAGEAFRSFNKQFYVENKFIKGEVMIGEERVDLKNITIPVLNIYAEQDHLVPPKSTLALGNYIGSKDYTVQSFPVGHIGMYVSGKVQQSLPPTIANWLKERA